jgi:hypothetical protein
MAAQQCLDLPIGNICATVLLETITAAFQMEEILEQLKDPSLGLKCGHWDYLFSFIQGAPRQDRSRLFSSDHGDSLDGILREALDLHLPQVQNVRDGWYVRVDSHQFRAGHDGT